MARQEPIRRTAPVAVPESGSAVLDFGADLGVDWDPDAVPPRRVVRGENPTGGRQLKRPPHPPPETTDTVAAPDRIIEPTTSPRDGLALPDWLSDVARPDWWDRLFGRRSDGIRVNPGRRGVLVLLGVGLVAALVTLVVTLSQRPDTQPVPLSVTHPGSAPQPPAATSVSSSAETTAPQPPKELVISVVGLVHHGGLVRLPPGSRVADALAAAGGARPGADLTGLNLAQRLTDGDQVVVGQRVEQQVQTRFDSAAADPTGSADSAESSAATPVNLNSATAAELEEIPGIGPVTAETIIRWRTTHGRFTSIEQLNEVDGIGPVRLSRLRDQVTL